MASAVKELIEDIKRHKRDTRINRTLCAVFYRKWKFKNWEEIIVGDIVRIHAGETIPADMVLLATSDSSQTCYIQTSNLDGETSYKIKYCRPECSLYTNEDHWNEKNAYIECDAPNSILNTFSGRMAIEDSQMFSLDDNQILLRGCQVKNTHWIVGVVIYTGNETKIMLKSLNPIIKCSTVDHKTNHIAIIMFVTIVCLTLMSVVICEAVYRNILWRHWYTKLLLPRYSLVFTIITFFILYHNMLPISLISTVEFVKLLQAYITNHDTKMYTDIPSNHQIVNTSSVIEDLGRVNFIFSDKTGTLTCNEMILKQMVIGDKVFLMDDSFIANLNNDVMCLKDVHFKMFIINLLLCNSIVAEIQPDGTLAFQSSSPDEIAIINSLDSYGFKFIKRTQEGILIDYLGTSEFWKVHHTIKFTSERKKMSVIALSPDNENYIFTKGAGESIFERLISSESNIGEKTKDLQYLASTGLRTLCVAYKELSEFYVEEICNKLNMAILHNEQNNKLYNRMCDEIETNLKFLGFTGIEDRLSYKVCDTIKAFTEAGIKIWMLTGDQIETAVNIAFSSKLVHEDMKLYRFSFKNNHECAAMLKDIIIEKEIDLEFGRKIKNPKLLKNMAIVLSGNDLQYLLSPLNVYDFLNITVYCRTVICCRVSPSQKMEIVSLVKLNVADVITLAVGDGVNDCNMIRSAHLGVGIAGKEGLQAANNADFAIDEFQLLTRLIFLHGAVSYRRLCNCIYFIFYKNYVLNFLSFMFNFLTLFSGQSIFNKLHFSLFNSLYTSIQPFCFGLMDQFTSHEASINVPYLYLSLSRNYRFSFKRLLGWCINAMIHSFMIFLLTYASHGSGTIGIHGQPMSIAVFEMVIFTNTLLVITLKATLEIRNLKCLCIIAVWIGFIIYVLVVLITSNEYVSRLLGIFDHMHVDRIIFLSPAFYFTILIPFMILLPDLIYHSIRNTWFPPAHLYINSIEHNREINWSEVNTVESIQSDLDKVTRQKDILKRKYLGFAFSFDESPGFSL